MKPNVRRCDGGQCQRPGMGGRVQIRARPQQHLVCCWLALRLVVRCALHTQAAHTLGSASAGQGTARPGNAGYATHAPSAVLLVCPALSTEKRGGREERRTHAHVGKGTGQAHRQSKHSWCARARHETEVFGTPPVLLLLPNLTRRPLYALDVLRGTRLHFAPASGRMHASRSGRGARVTVAGGSGAERARRWGATISASDARARVSARLAGSRKRARRQASLSFSLPFLCVSLVTHSLVAKL